MLTNNTLVYCHNVLTDKEHALLNKKHYSIIVTAGSISLLISTLLLMYAPPPSPLYTLGILLGIFIALYTTSRFVRDKKVKAHVEHIREDRESIGTDWMGYKMAGQSVYENCVVTGCIKEIKYGVELYRLTLHCDTHTDPLIIFSYPNDLVVYIEMYKHQYKFDSVSVHLDMLDDYDEHMAFRKLRHSQTVILDFHRSRG